MTEEEKPEQRKENRDLFTVFSAGTMLCSLMIVICAIMIIPLTSVVEDFLRAGNVIAMRTSQFVDDWQVVPFVEIITTDEKSCPSGYEPVFERTWGGTKEGCIINYIDYWTEQFTQSVYSMDDCVSMYSDGMLDKTRPLIANPDGSFWTAIPAEVPIAQTNFQGKSICGKRGGDAFMDVTRPESTTGECPSGTAACSLNTDVDETVCYPSADHELSCPITDIRLFTASEGRDMPDAAYTRLAYKNGYELAYSKQTDNLAVTTTRLETQPCNDPNQSSDYSYCGDDKETIRYVSNGNQNPPLSDYCKEYHELENDAWSGTGLTINGNYAIEKSCWRQDEFDTRYQKASASYSVSQLEIEDNSGVTDVLRALPQSNELYSGQERQTKDFQMWTRDTIPWSLECEASGKTRSQAASEFSTLSYDIKEEDLETPVYLFSYAIVFIIFGVLDCIFITAAFLLNKNDNACCPLVGHTIIMVLTTVLVFSTLFILSDNVQTGTYIKDMAAILNGCTDALSSVPNELVEQSSNATYLNEDKIPNLFYLLTFGYFCNFVLGLAYVLTSCGVCAKILDDDNKIEDENTIQDEEGGEQDDERE